MVEEGTKAQAAEVARGERFEFGANWHRFLSVLDDQRIAQAEASLTEMLDAKTLAGRSFLDIGSGSGLFSLAARRLGARVHSFDYDPQSVACASELKRRYFPNDAMWVIEPGSALDPAYVASLGAFDVVYSWGVLHHTGALWEALANAILPVESGGQLFIAIYNRQRYWSSFHLRVKRLYVRSPAPIKAILVGGFALTVVFRGLLKDLLTLRNPFQRYRSALGRGMSPWYDWIDWVGGYPFEVAKPEEIIDFLLARGFALTKLVTQGGGHGCNEYVFVRGAGSKVVQASHA